MTEDLESTLPHVLASGHRVRSVVADGEPPRHRRKALDDLAAALPTPEAFEAAGARLLDLATTPDFHPGRPVPVGVVADVAGAVLPHMIGNDVGCGMRMTVLDGVTEGDLAGAGGLEARLRHVFFQGGRDVSLTGRQRRSLLCGGLPGFVEALSRDRRGLLARMDLAAAEADLDRTCDLGVFGNGGLDPDFVAFVAGDDDHRHDAILGTIGGGNHFAELGVVERVEDGGFARIAGLRTGSIVIVVHSGSLDFGQRVGSRTRTSLASSPTSGDRRILKADAEGADRYRVGLANAANAAFGNRLLISLAAAEAVRRATGREVATRLVYDAPHNMVWDRDGVVRHRKGACPAGDGEAMRGSPYGHHGEPVILPGSMGDGTWLLKGTGSDLALGSAAHGAGRRLSRREARTKGAIPARLRVVGPVDFAHPSLAGRRDVLAESEARLREEAPSAYRPIDDVVDPMVAAGLVGRVARVRPVLTAKG